MTGKNDKVIPGRQSAVALAKAIENGFSPAFPDEDSLAGRTLYQCEYPDGSRTDLFIVAGTGAHASHYPPGRIPGERPDRETSGKAVDVIDELIGWAK
jgi:hypothetical protein